MTAEKLATLIAGAAAVYLPDFGGNGVPIVHAGMTGGEIWLLMPGDSFHLMDTRGLEESETAGGIVTWTNEAGETRLVIAPLIWCDELNRADEEAEIATERAHYAEPEGKRWLEASIADAEKEVASRA